MTPPSPATRAACRAAEHALRATPTTPSAAAAHLAQLNRAWRALNAAPPGLHDPLSHRWHRAERQLIAAHASALALLRTLHPSTVLRDAIHAALRAENREQHDRAEHHWQVAAREAKRLTPPPTAPGTWHRPQLSGQPIFDARARRFRS